MPRTKSPSYSRVSTFELLLAPLAPRLSAPQSDDTNLFARRVVQGYFLTIANVDCTRELNLQLRFTVSPDVSVPTGSNPPGSPVDNNELTLTNHSSVFNRGGMLSPFPPLALTQSGTCGAAKLWFSEQIVLPPGETGIFALLPSVGNDALRNDAQLSVRGFVEIIQIGTPGGKCHPCTFGTIPSAQILLTPEHRGTFLPNELGSVGPSGNVVFDRFGRISSPQVGQALPRGLDFDQLSYALPLAEGKALYKLSGGLVVMGSRCN
jgi:hypothetical protein